MSRKYHTPAVLLIGGSDSGGGAGLQADLRAVHAHGVAGACVVTAATAQNPMAVRSLNALRPSQIAAQIDAVLEDIDIAVIKIGMLGNEAVSRVVFDKLRDCGLPIVLDPVMVATSGGVLLRASAMSTLRKKLLPLSAILTPNIPEASALLGRSLHSIADRRAGARALVQMGAGCVLLKGGHSEGATMVDIIADSDGITELRSRRLSMRTHGTGCTFASAIAARIALGETPIAAITGAHDYLQRALRRPFRLGSEGVCSPGVVVTDC